MAKNPAETKYVLPRRLAAGIQTLDITTGKSKDSTLSDSSLLTMNQEIAAVRSQSTVSGALRLLKRRSGEVATAIASFVRLANTPLKFEAYDSQHQLSDEGSQLITSIVQNFETLADSTYGFDDRQSLKGLTDTLFNEVLYTGACAGELVLDKALLPFCIRPVSTDTLKWKISKVSSGKTTTKIIPYQQSGGATTELDIPTFFYSALDAAPGVVYPKSPIEAAVNAAVFGSEVLEDIRRVVRRSGHSRLVMTLIVEKLVQSAPVDIATDPVKLSKWIKDVRDDLNTQLENLNPESALVLFDTCEADYLNSEIGASADYGPLMEVVDGLTATSLRTPPSVLGKRMGGSQNVSSTESLLFIKQAAGLHVPVASLLTRAFTLAVRLYGFDGYVKAAFDPIDLRPESELEAFKAMKQTRIIELLSLGFLSDRQAAEILGTGPITPGTEPLSGTMFHQGPKGMDVLGMTPDSAANADPGKRGLAGNKAPTKAGGASK